MQEWLYKELKEIFDRVYYYFPLQEIEPPYLCFTEVSNTGEILNTEKSLEASRFQIDYYALTAEDCFEMQKNLKDWTCKYYEGYPYLEYIESKINKEGDYWRLIFEIRIHFRR